MRRVLYVLNLLTMVAVLLVIPPLALNAYGWHALLGIPAQLIVLSAIGHNLEHLTIDPKDTPE